MQLLVPVRHPAALLATLGLSRQERLNCPGWTWRENLKALYTLEDRLTGRHSILKPLDRKVAGMGERIPGQRN